jgi:DNA-binding MarR family transcriptional regulator
MPEPDPPAELERRAEEASSAYEDNIALRALVVAIPGIGSSLDLVLSSAGQAYRERIHRLIDAMKDDMQERMETIENSALDQEYLESEEFRDLLMRALEAAIKTRDAEQRRVYARILTESTILSAREGHSPEEYLDLIAALTPLELHVARSLYKELPRARYESREVAEVQEAWKCWQGEMCAEAGIDRADLQLILGRLNASGLITEEGGLFPRGFGPLDEPLLYWVSRGFEKLMQFLERRDAALEG